MAGHKVLSQALFVNDTPNDGVADVFVNPFNLSVAARHPDWRIVLSQTFSIPWSKSCAANVSGGNDCCRGLGVSELLH
jgi:hypothetical protein